MTKRHLSSRAPRLLLALALLCGCASDEGGVDPGRTTIHFAPAPGTVILDAYEVVDFRALTQNGQTVPARWTLAGADQGSLADFRFVGAIPGEYNLAATLQYDGVDYAASWLLQVGSESSSITPAVGTLSAAPGAIPGSVQVFWETPAASSIEVPLREFELWFSRTDFAEADLPQMTPILVAVDAGQIQQNRRIDGLPERQNHFVRVRVVDVLDRRSALSAAGQSESTGHFDLSGSVEKLVPLLPVQKGPGILIELGAQKVVTDQLGSFALFNLPDILSEYLSVAEESGVGYYEFRSLTKWQPLTQQIGVTLFARDIVLIDDRNPSGGFPEFLSTLEYVRLMSHNANRPSGSPQLIYRWESYPVQVYAPPYSSQGVDYRQAFERGVAAWNEKLGEVLLEIVDAPVAVGVDYAVDILPSSGLLGDTVQLSPAGGLFTSVPERLRIRLLEFGTQALADRIVAHELGHVLMLNHSPSRTHLMIVGASPSDGDWPHRDEAFAARVIRHLAQQLDLRVYREPSGKQQVSLPPLGDGGGCGVSSVRFDRSRN